jgi:hypothetical protein
MEVRTKTFTDKGKEEPDWVFVTVLRFAQTQKELVEVIVQSSIYVGFPAVIAIEIARKVFRKRDQKRETN